MKLTLCLAAYLCLDAVAGVAIWRWVTVPMLARLVAALHGVR